MSWSTLRAVGAGRRDLLLACIPRHHDRQSSRFLGGAIGKRLGVVSRRSGDHARSRSAGVSAASLLSTPRGLNEPVRWNSSAFRNTSQPTRSDVRRELKAGVR